MQGSRGSSLSSQPDIVREVAEDDDAGMELHLDLPTSGEQSGCSKRVGDSAVPLTGPAPCNAYHHRLGL
jgi:hypothetical protein